MQDLCGKDGTQAARRKMQLFRKTCRNRDQTLLHVTGDRCAQPGKFLLGEVAGNDRAARFQCRIGRIPVGRSDFQHRTLGAAGMLGKLECNRRGFFCHDPHRIAGGNEPRLDFSRPFVRDLTRLRFSHAALAVRWPRRQIALQQSTTVGATPGVIVRSRPDWLARVVFRAFRSKSRMPFPQWMTEPVGLFRRGIHAIERLTTSVMFPRHAPNHC